MSADPSSFGFRPGRCPQDTIEQCFNALAKNVSPKWVLEGDIKGCFDHISHQWILENIPIDKKILSKWLKCGYIETKKLFPTDEGAPQGSPISSVICNMVQEFMAERGLQLSEEKTVITHIDDGSDFLGCNLRKYKGELLIKPSKKNLKGTLDKIRKTVKENPTIKQECSLGGRCKEPSHVKSNYSRKKKRDLGCRSTSAI